MFSLLVPLFMLFFFFRSPEGNICFYAIYIYSPLGFTLLNIFPGFVVSCKYVDKRSIISTASLRNDTNLKQNTRRTKMGFGFVIPQSEDGNTQEKEDKVHELFKKNTRIVEIIAIVLIVLYVVIRFF